MNEKETSSQLLYSLVLVVSGAGIGLLFLGKSVVGTVCLTIAFVVLLVAVFKRDEDSPENSIKRWYVDHRPMALLLKSGAVELTPSPITSSEWEELLTSINVHNFALRVGLDGQIVIEKKNVQPPLFGLKSRHAHRQQYSEDDVSEEFVMVFVSYVCYCAACGKESFLREVIQAFRKRDPSFSLVADIDSNVLEQEEPKERDIDGVEDQREHPTL